MIHLQRNFEDAPENEYDPVVQGQWLHSFLQAHETDRCPAHSLRFPNGLRIHLKGRYAGNHQRNKTEKIAQFQKIVHIDAKPKTATPLINTGVMAVLGFIKCQRWDYASSINSFYYVLFFY